MSMDHMETIFAAFRRTTLTIESVKPDSEELQIKEVKYGSFKPISLRFDLPTTISNL